MRGPGRPRRSGPADNIGERIRLRRQAADHLTRAQAALLDSFEGDNLAYTLVWIGLAMLKIAKSDPDERAYETSLKIIDQMRAQHPPRQPGPYSGT